MLDDIVKEAAKAVERERRTQGLRLGLDDALLKRWEIPSGTTVIADRERVKRLRTGKISNGWVPHLIRQVVPPERWREVARHELAVRACTTAGAVDELVRAAHAGPNMIGWSTMIARLMGFDDPLTAKDWLVLAR